LLKTSGVALVAPSALHARGTQRRRQVQSALARRLRAAALLRLTPPPGGEEALLARARDFARTVGAPVRLQVCLSLEGAHAYIYGWMDPETLSGQAAGLRLSPLAEWSGASAGEEARYHYVVATDIEQEWEPEFNDWYRTEHMPGLAAVPGTVHCARLISQSGVPQYHACYDLVSPKALERDEWMAVRQTLWSTRVRPHFRNTRRIMFRTVLDERRAIHGAFF
jgi:hypothetical protein